MTTPDIAPVISGVETGSCPVSAAAFSATIPTRMPKKTTTDVGGVNGFPTPGVLEPIFVRENNQMSGNTTAPAATASTEMRSDESNWMRVPPVNPVISTSTSYFLTHVETVSSDVIVNWHIYPQ